MTRHSEMIQGIVGIRSTFGQKPKSFHQNNLLENKSENSKRPEKLGLEELSTEKFVDWESMKA